MKISERWLREWVAPALDRDSLADQLTMLGLEVDEIIDHGQGLDGFLVGRIIAIEAHPAADRLTLCQVDVGADAPLTIVCGAPNARAGIQVAVAPVGVALPNGTRIKAATIRGQDSHGMLCSAAELGLSNDGAGIMELDTSATPGMALDEHLGLPDSILEIDLTPNRGDCLSLLGVAREVAVANNLPLAEPAPEPLSPVIDASIDVTIEAPDLCTGYAARCVFDVDAQAATPDWLAERLQRGGVRTISLPVDICNLVMLELGQPMHAFDYDQLQGGITIRRAAAGEQIRTLDDEQVILDQGTLVIADASGPIAMAGMLGGADTAVGAATTRVVLEAANFTPASIAGQGRRYKIHTDSSHRFERGVDPAIYLRAMERASALLAELGGGRLGPVNNQSGQPQWPADRAITLHLDAVDHLLGQQIPAADSRHALTALGMKVMDADERIWHVTPPSWRHDIALEVDLIEEIARIYGYDRLQEHAEGSILPQTSLPEGQLSADELFAVLRQRGYNEVITYSFVDAQLQSALLGQALRIDLANPIAEQLAQMRETLWASLLPAWAYNRRRQHANIRLYEYGKRFVIDRAAENGVAQIDTLAGIMDGEAAPRHWDTPQRAVDFFDIKGDVEALLAMGQHKARFVAAEHPALHPGRSAAVYLGEKCVGWLGQLAPEFSKTYKIKELPYLFELNYNELKMRPVTRYSNISEQPSVQRDLAVIVRDALPAGQLVAAIEGLQEPLLREVAIFDLFYPESLESGFKSIALRLIFQDKKGTLTDSAVDDMLERIVAALESQYDARIRGA